MVDKSFNRAVAIGLLLFCGAASQAVQNPDEITVFFPAFEGQGKLGVNVSTVLSLQLAQTMRRHPWPTNKKEHDFGRGMIRWRAEPLEVLSFSQMTKIAQERDLLAQIVVAGKTRRYGNDIIVEVDVALPEYRRPWSSSAESPEADRRRDFREENFEVWRIDLGDDFVEVGVPKRNFSIAAIVLKPGVVERYSTASGLEIRSAIADGVRRGETGDALDFLEFNTPLPGAPTKIRSGGVEGYVSLPELSQEVSEFADMVGGVLQVFRGDWDWAVRSFTRVIENSKTRVPLKVDALLYRGMAKIKNGDDGYPDIAEAADLAPYDATVVRYQVMALLASGKGGNAVRQVLERQSYLFDSSDEWLIDIRRWLTEN